MVTKSTYVTKCLCGVIGCGFNLRWEKHYGLWTLLLAQEPEFMHFKKESFDSLKYFKEPEMYLGSIDTSNWDMFEIIKQQQLDFRRMHNN